MSEDEDEYIISYKMPAWMRVYLAEMGIPREFKIKDLTNEQAEAINIAVEMEKLVRKGLVEVIYDPAKYPSPLFKLKRKSKK